MSRSDTPLENRHYRHFKGGLYKVVCVARDATNHREQVVYQAQDEHYPDTWVRELDGGPDAWMVPAVKDGAAVKRFTDVTEQVNRTSRDVTGPAGA